MSPLMRTTVSVRFPSGRIRLRYSDSVTLLSSISRLQATRVISLPVSTDDTMRKVFPSNVRHWNLYSPGSRVTAPTTRSWATTMVTLGLSRCAGWAAASAGSARTAMAAQTTNIRRFIRAPDSEVWRPAEEQRRCPAPIAGSPANAYAPARCGGNPTARCRFSGGVDGTCRIAVPCAMLPAATGVFHEKASDVCRLRNRARRGVAAVRARPAGLAGLTRNRGSQAIDVPKHRSREPGGPCVRDRRRPWKPVRVLRLGRQRRRLQDRQWRHHLEADLRQPERALDRRDRAGALEPRHHLCRDRRREPAQQRVVRRRRLSQQRRRGDVDARRP